MTGVVAVTDVIRGIWLEKTDVLVKNGRIAALVPTGEGDAVEIMKLDGGYLLPAFIDSHVHIESSMLTPGHFSDLVVPQGTGTVLADPHEIANVCGLSGLNYMISAGTDAPLDIRWMLPSCVPATAFETSGAVLEAGDLETYFSDSSVLGQGEVMDAAGA